MSFAAQTYYPELTFEVEPTIKCNANCVMCPREKTPRRQDMDMDTFVKVLDRIDEYPSGQPLKAIHLCGLGEPSMHKNIVEMVRISTERKFFVTMQTNAKILNRDLSSKLMDAGLKGFFISVGGHTKETYEMVLKGCKFDVFQQNVHDLLAYRNERYPNDVIVTMALTPTVSTQVETVDVVHYWRPFGVDYFFSEIGVVSRGGAVNMNKFNKAHELKVIDLNNQVQLAEKHGLDSWNAFVFSRLSMEDYRFFEQKAKFFCFLKEKLYYIGCDGEYYLGSCDYEKISPLGSVYDYSVVDMQQKKYQWPQQGTKCENCSDWAGMYGSTFEEISRIVERQPTTHKIIEHIFGIADRKGMISIPPQMLSAG